MLIVNLRESMSKPSWSLKLDNAVSTYLSMAKDIFRMVGQGGPSTSKLDSMLATIAESMWGMISAMRLSSTYMCISVMSRMPLVMTPQFCESAKAGVIGVSLRGSSRLIWWRYA